MNKLIESIKIKNLLSFNSEGIELNLNSLNVLIGPNGSGKSNFIEAICLFQSAPHKLVAPVRDNGGISTWLYKGEKQPVAHLEIITSLVKTKFDIPVKHSISFGETANRFELRDEAIEDVKSTIKDTSSPYFYYQFRNNHPVLNVGSEQRRLERADIDPEQSIISQRKDPCQFP